MAAPIKTRYFSRKTPSEIELRRVQYNEEPHGVATDFTVAGIADFFCETWSIEPDPRAASLRSYAANKVHAFEAAGFVEITASQFARGVKQRLVEVPPGTPVYRTERGRLYPLREPSAEAMKRNDELIRYLKKADGTIRFVDASGTRLQWWLVSFEDKGTLCIEQTLGKTAQRCWYHLDQHEADYVIDEIETEFCIAQIHALKKRGYRYASAAQLERAQAKRANQLSK